MPGAAIQPFTDASGGWVLHGAQLYICNALQGGCVVVGSTGVNSSATKVKIGVV